MRRSVVPFEPPAARPGEPTLGSVEFVLAAELAQIAARARVAGWRVAFAVEFGEGAVMTFSASRPGEADA